MYLQRLAVASRVIVTSIHRSTSIFCCETKSGGESADFRWLARCRCTFPLESRTETDQNSKFLIPTKILFSSLKMKQFHRKKAKKPTRIQRQRGQTVLGSRRDLNTRQGVLQVGTVTPTWSILAGCTAVLLKTSSSYLQWNREPIPWHTIQN